MKDDLPRRLDRDDRASPAHALDETATFPETPAEILRALPARLGRFRIHAVLGSGGMGAVFEAEADDLPRRVALKIIKPGLMSPATRARFEFEGRVLARLEHPGIARLYEFGELAGDGAAVPFFSMELVRGDRITTHAQRARLDARQRLELVALVCDAVQHAHQKGVLHRDLKPANVVVDGEGKVRILDFGVARAIDADDDAGQLTQSGQIVGTLAYMSPEQVRLGSDDLDTRSDVYSLGVVTYELLAGQRPYSVSDRSLVEAARTICEAEPPRLGRLDSRLAGDVETIVGKAMEKDREARYASAAELAADIRRYLASEPILARQIGWFGRMRRFARRKPALAALSLATAILGLVVVTAAPIWIARESRLRGAAEDRADESQRRFGIAAAALEELVNGVDNRLRNRVGTRELQRELLLQAARGFEELARESPDDAEVARFTVLARVLLGDVLLRLEGKVTSALDQYTQALGVAEERRRADPESHESRKDVAMCRQRLGDAWMQLGELAQAREQFTRCFDLLERLAQPSADSTLADDQAGPLAVALERLADVASRQGDCATALAYRTRRADLLERAVGEAAVDQPSAWDQMLLAAERGEISLLSRDAGAALARFTEAAGYCREMVDADPYNYAANRKLAFLLDRMADLSLITGATPQAKDHYLGALAISQGLMRADPQDFQSLRDMSISFARLGDAQEALGDFAAARDAFDQGLAASRRLANVDPVDSQAQRDLSIALERVGDAKMRARDLPGALAIFGEMHGIRARLADADPDDAQAQRDLATSLDKLGDANRRAQEMATALAHYRQGLEIRRGLVERFPSDAAYQRDVSLSLDKVGQALIGLERIDEASDCFSEALSIDRRLAELDPTSANAKRDLSISLNRVAAFRRAGGAPREALELYLECLAIRQDAARLDPANARAKADLAVAYTNLGEVSLELADGRAALGYGDESLALFRELAALDSTDLRFQSDLASAHERLGDAHLACGSPREASGHYDECREIRSRLAGPDAVDPLPALELALALAKAGIALQASGEFARAAQVDCEALAILARYDEAARLAARPDSADWIPDIERRVRICEAAANLDDIESLLAQPADIAPDLLLARAQVFAALGDVETAASALEVLRARFQSEIARLRSDAKSAGLMLSPELALYFETPATAEPQQ